jgi:hypothetical protein
MHNLFNVTQHILLIIKKICVGMCDIIVNIMNRVLQLSGQKVAMTAYAPVPDVVGSNLRPDTGYPD